MKQQDTNIQSQNHSETVAADEAPTLKLTDLPVNNQQEEEVKGGLLLPAVQKVREAAARTQTAVGSSGMSAGKVSYSDLS